MTKVLIDWKYQQLSFSISLSIDKCTVMFTSFKIYLAFIFFFHFLLFSLWSGESDSTGASSRGGGNPEQPGDPDIFGPHILPHGGLGGRYQFFGSTAYNNVSGNDSSIKPEGAFTYAVKITCDVCNLLISCGVKDVHRPFGRAKALGLAAKLKHWEKNYANLNLAFHLLLA